MKSFIDKGYVLICTTRTIERIKNICPKAKCVDISAENGVSSLLVNNDKFLVDRYLIENNIVKLLLANNKNFVVEYAFSLIALEKLEVECLVLEEKRPLEFKERPINEWVQAFDSIKKVVSESDIDISDSEIGNLVYHLGKTGIIGLDLSSTKDYSAF